MQYIAYIQRGDFARAADISFDCVMCGLCVSRCPVHIVHYNAALTARRLYSRYIALPSPQLKQRTREILAGNFEPEIQELMKADKQRLQDLYNSREIE